MFFWEWPAQRRIPKLEQCGMNDPHALGADLGPAEQPWLSAHRENPQGVFGVVGVDGQFWINEVETQRVLAFACVLERIARHEVDALALGVAPGPPPCVST